MKILKFGGTSVGSAQRIRSVASIVASIPGRKVLVLSAMSGTTDTLVEIGALLLRGKQSEAAALVDKLRERYLQIVVKELFKEEDLRTQARLALLPILDDLRAQTLNESFTSNDEKRILSRGEMMSTTLMALALQHYEKVVPTRLNALSFMRIDHEGRPDTTYISSHLRPLIEANQGEDTLFLTEGYISVNAFGEIDNLRRGGSDYTATLIGEAICADEVQIWTDIDGLHNNDPRIVNVTSPVRRLNFGEAAELARFGAKILHPACIEPARRGNIPVKLLYTLDPLAPGTVISSETSTEMIKAVSAKDGMCVITLSQKMTISGAPSVSETLIKISDLLEKYHLVVDIMTHSGDTFVLVVEDHADMAYFCEEAQELLQVHCQRDMTILAVVGDMGWQRMGFEAQVLTAVDYIPIRMIAYGSSNYGIDLVIATEDKNRAMIALSDHLFSKIRVQGPEMT